MDEISRTREIAGKAGLLPCECGEQDMVGYNERWKTSAEIAGAPYRGYFFQCYSCGARGPYGGVIDAADAWNRGERL